MKNWNLTSVEAPPQQAHILSTTDDARAIILRLPAGERMQEHEVHERAWVVVVEGEVEVRAGDERTLGAPGALFEFAPHERHELAARSDARLLLLLTPWPGEGHPGALSIEQKAEVRDRAATHAPPS